MAGLLTKREDKMAGYWSSSFFCVFMDRDGNSQKRKRKRTRPISGHLDRTGLVDKGLIISLSGRFFFRNAARSPERTR